jgi:hypothetical protein
METEIDAAEYFRLTQVMANLIGMEPSAIGIEPCVNTVSEFLVHKGRLDEVASIAKKYLENPPKTPTEKQTMVLGLARNFVNIYKNAITTLENLKKRANMATGCEKYIPSSDSYSK